MKRIKNINPHKDFQNKEEFWKYVKKGIEEGEEDITNGHIYTLKEVIQEFKEGYGLSITR